MAGPKAAPAIVHGNLTEPVWDVLHAAGPDGCLVGGFVYRGLAHPSLAGKFLAVDNVSGRIRASTPDGTAASAEVLTSMPSGSVYSGTSTIGRDHDGEPVFIKIDGTAARGRFMKLAIVPPVGSKPVSAPASATPMAAMATPTATSTCRNFSAGSTTSRSS